MKAHAYIPENAAYNYFVGKARVRLLCTNDSHLFCKLWTVLLDSIYYGIDTGQAQAHLLQNLACKGHIQVNLMPPKVHIHQRPET